jgi:hypothetical protein
MRCCRRCPRCGRRRRFWPRPRIWTREWADRFHQNLHGDSERLAAGAEALVAYLDAGSTMAEQGIAAPQEEVEDWLLSRGWTFDDGELGGRAWRPRWRAGLIRRAQSGAGSCGKACRMMPEPCRSRFCGGGGRSGAGPFHAGRPLAVTRLVMRRLAGLPTGAGLVLCDASGTLTFRKPGTGLSACRALGRPVRSGRFMPPLAAPCSRSRRW